MSDPIEILTEKRRQNHEHQKALEAEHAQLRAEDDRLERAIAVLQGQERAP